MQTIRIVLPAALACLFAADAFAQDTIVTREGRRMRGVEIVGLTTEFATYKQGDQELQLAADKVAEITWADPPEAFGLGRAALRTGDFATAVNQFLEAAQKTEREPLKAEATYLAGEAMARAGASDPAKAADAAQMLADWLNNHPDGFRTPDAMLARGRALIAADQPQEAETILETLANDSLTKNWPLVWGALAKFEQARAQMKREQYASARTTFRAAISAAKAARDADTGNQELLSLEADANVGIGETWVSEKNFDDALRYYRDLAKTAENPAVRAAALAGEGEALLLRAETAGNQEGLGNAWRTKHEGNEGVHVYSEVLDAFRLHIFNHVERGKCCGGYDVGC